MVETPLDKTGIKLPRPELRLPLLSPPTQPIPSPDLLGITELFSEQEEKEPGHLALPVSLISRKRSFTLGPKDQEAATARTPPPAPTLIIEQDDFEPPASTAPAAIGRTLRRAATANKAWASLIPKARGTSPSRK